MDAARQDDMQQPAGVNEGRGQGWTLEAMAQRDDM